MVECPPRIDDGRRWHLVHVILVRGLLAIFARPVERQSTLSMCPYERAATKKVGLAKM
jgi:hypothetical protein